ncbi:reverse transcriptase domain-containing protein [Phenylobacterium koreense]|uniref:Reverse transcriptase domain-containing protein n=1 Tax=Phenylobacterium koreense TaxID=266125 RepID=A0ABV2EMX1_9CAUL
MVFQHLEPTINCLADETVLIQAWKKASAYIRYHNWFSDTLELDRRAINLPEFIASISDEVKSGEPVVSESIRMVPAPKSQRWRVTGEGLWEPAEKRKAASKIRPLAHVSLRDQVLATALMMCLADRVETRQGNPSLPLDSADLHGMISYGNRLFSDYNDGKAQQRWGSSTLYRGFYEDYQSFLARPEKVAERTDATARRIFIVQSDLRQFYDRVTPSLLEKRVRELQVEGDDPAFFDLAIGFLRWSWAQADISEVQIYAQQAGLSDFGTVVLPQGLVSSGFFANIALLTFDDELKAQINKDIAPDLKLHDASRYVDDLRLVISGPAATKIETVQNQAFEWLEALLDQTAPGLEPAAEKTQASAFRADERPLVQQSKRMARIQTAISGGFDPIGGGEVLDSVLALIRAQARLASSDPPDTHNPFTPVPDVRDATVDRFAAGRFRTTYRSLRPLLWESEEAQRREGENDDLSQFKGVRTRRELDDETRAFALELIAKWVRDPSNVRLLRIALDLWPAPDILEKILALLRPFTEKGGRRSAPRRVAWYCLSEILRAGATETGFVRDIEQLPSAVDLDAYRQRLRAEALRIVRTKNTDLPWYLKQQAYLLLATNPPADLRNLLPGKKSPLQPYRSLIRFLLGEFGGLATADFATYAVLARRSYVDRDKAIELAGPSMSPARLNRIASLDPNFAAEIIGKSGDATDLLPRALADLGIESSSVAGHNSLASIVLGKATRELLRNERSLLSFAAAFLKSAATLPPDVTSIAPSEVGVRLSSEESQEVAEVYLHPRNLSGASLYEPPAWVPAENRWRIQLGFLLRFILTAQPDFTRTAGDKHWKEGLELYRSPGSHCHQRIYGLFNGHTAFGDDWLPISDWTEQLLFGLLWWPGCAQALRSREIVSTLQSTRDAISVRLEKLRELQGSSAALLPLRLPRVFAPLNGRPLRACVAQTVFPSESDFNVADLQMSSAAHRTRHRRHLSAALAAVKSALALRETHKGMDGRLDWLILPELAVHPDDVTTHLVPFARAHKAVILAGLTYQELFAGQPLINSAVWVLPTQDPHRGLQVLLRRQGKKHLAPLEQTLNQSAPLIQSFRPCQWLIGYEWSVNTEDDPLWLTGAICYDATDIGLAADLKNRSDVFVVPALNRDVTTFDQMALALHYHMYQMVVVANNGRYGGSNAYAPFRDPWNRQVFHVHGQPQASISFFELDHIADFKARKNGQTSGQYHFKPVPAGS